MTQKLAWVSAIAVVALALALLREWNSYAPQRARARSEPWRQKSDWTATIVHAKFPIPAPVLKAFAADPPAPDGRKTLFAKFLDPSARHRCFGWRGSIDAVTPIGEDWEVSASIRAHLPGTAFCSTLSIETWRISSSGEARCVKTSAKPGALMID